MSSNPWSYLATGKFFPPTESVIIRSLVDGKKDADEARRETLSERIDLYEDDTLEMLRTRLSTQYELENYREIFKTTDISNNLCKRIIRQISNVYDKPPIWKLATDDGGVWDALRKESRLDLIQPKINQYTNLCNECLVRIAVVKGKLCYHVITPDLVCAEQDPEDPTQFIALRYWVGNVNTSNDTGYWVYWDRNFDNPRHLVLDVKGRDVSQKFGLSGVNPYRDARGYPIIPIVLYHRDLPIARLWDQHSGGDMVDGTLMVMAMESILNHLFRVDGHAQKWIQGALDNEAMQGQIGGANRMLLLRALDGGSVNVGQFASQADWAGLRSVIDAKIRTLGNNYGLSSAALEIDSTASSGFSLRVRKEEMIENRARQLPLYAAYDRELYEKTAIVWNYERKNAAGRPEAVGIEPADGKPMLTIEEADPQIHYAKYQVPQTAAEKIQQQQIDDKRLAQGLISVIDLYREDHPDASEDEARATIEANKQANADLEGKTTVAGDANAPAQADPNAVAPDTALNGAQVASMLSIIQSVATRQLPRDTGVEMITAAFPVTKEEAEAIVGSVGQTFFAEPPGQANAQQPTLPAPGTPLPASHHIAALVADRVAAMKAKKNGGGANG